MQRLLLSLLGVCATATTAISAPTLPAAPARWVEDPAAFLSVTTRAALDARLEGYQRATGHQVVVWIGKTLDGAPLDDWAVHTFAAWQVGRRGFDDGIAMFVLADDHTIDIEVGYGLEARVPDAIASRIIRDVMAPRLRLGDRDGSVTSGVDALLAAIEGQPWAGAVAIPAPETGHSLLTWILGGLAVIAFLILGVTHPRLALLLLWAFSGGRRGGGGGGFSGGGGRSGGGGTRGSW